MLGYSYNSTFWFSKRKGHYGNTVNEHKATRIDTSSLIAILVVSQRKENFGGNFLGGWISFSFLQIINKKGQKG